MAKMLESFDKDPVARQNIDKNFLLIIVSSIDQHNKSFQLIDSCPVKLTDTGLTITTKIKGGQYVQSLIYEGGARKVRLG